MTELREPKEITLTAQDGSERTYVISKFDSLSGREIIAKYPLSNMPKLGNYAGSEEAMLKLMAYVGVPRDDGTILRLSTRALVDNHVPDWEVLVKIEFKMLEYNGSFLKDGRAATFLEGLIERAQPLLTKALADMVIRRPVNRG